MRIAGRPHEQPTSTAVLLERHVEHWHRVGRDVFIINIGDDADDTPEREWC
jgi:hypothetical protein